MKIFPTKSAIRFNNPNESFIRELQWGNTWTTAVAVAQSRIFVSTLEVGKSTCLEYRNEGCASNHVSSFNFCGCDTVASN